MSPRPHPIEHVAAALQRLSVAAPVRFEAALHLASPARSAVGLDITVDPEPRWRGRSAPAPTDGSIEEAARAAVGLITPGWCSDDDVIDLDGQCLKIMRSGAHLVAFGAQLHTGAHLLLDPAIGEAELVAAAWIEAWRRGVRAPAVWEVHAEQFLVEGDAHSVVLRPAARGAEVYGETVDCWAEVDELAGELTDVLDLERIEVATLGSRSNDTVDVDYVGSYTCRRGAFEVIVPATLGRCSVIGAPHGEAGPEVRDWYGTGESLAWYDLEGFVPLEPSLTEPGWVARHVASGIAVIVRRPDGDFPS
jgi:hypothetical protein